MRTPAAELLASGHRNPTNSTERPERPAGAAVALAARRLSYLGADTHARLLFLAQPPQHGRATGGVAFAAALLPTLDGGLPTHWLSDESVDSLRRWCEEEGTPLHRLRAVVGRVVHVEGPIAVTAADSDAGGGTNPHSLPVGEVFFRVHAEMMLQHRWTTL